MQASLVFVPGLMADARLFLPQIVKLGAGHSCQILLPTIGETVEQMSEALLPCLPRSCVLIGHGLGGSVALDLVRRAPAQISRLALISCDPLSEGAQAAGAREMRIVAARAGRLAEAIAQEIPEAALAPNEWRHEVLALVRDMALSLGEGVFVRQSRALQRRQDQQKTMRKTTIPTLVIAGALDTLVTPRRQEFTANLLPSARLQIIPGAGHLPSLEDPEAVIACLRDFVSAPALAV